MIARSAAPDLRPAITLMILAPVIAEVLSGATRLSYIFVLVPEILVWGGGTLLIREVVRRWGGGWTSILLLGIGLSMAEEFLIQQTSLAPLAWLGNTPTYGRVWGVNWVFLLIMLGYESVWVVLLPMQLTELIFPERRNAPWLRLRSTVITSILFVVGAFVAWFAWTQRARPMIFHVPKYVPPRVTMLIAVLLIAVLIMLAYAVRNPFVQGGTASRKAPLPWVVGLGTMALALIWWMLMIPTLAVPPPRFSPWILMAGGIAWAALAFFVVERWATSTGWQDLHRWALVSSAILVCMGAGFWGSSTWSRKDLIAKVVMNAIAAVLLLLLRKKIPIRNAA